MIGVAARGWAGAISTPRPAISPSLRVGVSRPRWRHHAGQGKDRSMNRIRPMNGRPVGGLRPSASARRNVYSTGEQASRRLPERSCLLEMRAAGSVEPTPSARFQVMKKWLTSGAAAPGAGPQAEVREVMRMATDRGDLALAASARRRYLAVKQNTYEWGAMGTEIMGSSTVAAMPPASKDGGKNGAVRPGALDRVKPGDTRSDMAIIGRADDVRPAPSISWASTRPGAYSCRRAEETDCRGKHSPKP